MIDQGPQLSATTTALLILGTIFVALRFVARWITATGYGADDWFMFAGLIVGFVTGGLNYGMIASGLGRPASSLSEDQLVQFFKLLLVFECTYITGVALIKISVLLMYLRIFPSSRFRITAIIIGSTVVAWWIAIFFVCIFQCDPVSKAWIPWSDGQCLDLKASFIANAVPNIATDVAILAMPVTQVVGLQMKLAQKCIVLVMFLLGSFVLFASIFRFSTIMQFDINNTTETLAVACTWCVIEICCGAISGCLPTMRPLLLRMTHFLGDPFSLRSDQRSRYPHERSACGSRTIAVELGPTKDIGKAGKQTLMSPGRGSFTKIDEPSEDGDSMTEALNTRTAVTSSSSKRSQAPEDERPLRGIQVHVQIKQERRKLENKDCK